MQLLNRIAKFCNLPQPNNSRSFTHAQHQQPFDSLFDQSHTANHNKSPLDQQGPCLISILSSLQIQKIEDSSALTSIFYENELTLQLQSLQWLQSNLKEYIRVKLKNQSRTARLGFSSEKELLNIAAKLFSTEIKTKISERRILGNLWNTI